MPSTDDAYRELLDRAREIHALTMTKELLEWDQETCMPKKGVELRSREVAALAGVIHERETDGRLGELLEQLTGAELEPGPAANLRDIRRSVDRARKVPAALVKQIAEVGSKAMEAWARARQQSDFEAFAPLLTRMVELKREQAGCLTTAGAPLYDALLDEFEEGATVTETGSLLAALRDRLVPLAQKIRESSVTPDEGVVQGHFPLALQQRLCREVAAALGFDFEGGRLDVSAHPFTCGTLGDTRITTRYDEGDLRPALFALVHEAGHGMYEQGLHPEHLGTPLGMYCSMGLHESQSRLWENAVGRSRAFCQHLFAKANEIFPDGLKGDAEALYRAVNVSRSSLIRVEADEVTYNLHIVIRFEIERDLISGALEVADLPATWNGKYEALLGITPPDDAQGCLQDVHWAWGLFGYFPTYTLGNLYAAQFYARASQDIDDLDGKLAAGETAALLQWLREKIHRQGRLLQPAALVEQVCGTLPSAEPFMEYLETKYGELYGL